ncbi:MAG: hypothetical protein ABFS56_33970 [Pseudomonadota bacterium]
MQSDYLGFRWQISIDTKIFEYTFSGAEPIGSYQIGGRLLHPFSGDAISTDIEVLTFSQ